MKYIGLILSFALLSVISSAQDNTNPLPETQKNDSAFKTQHLLGLNVFPAFGILGGGLTNNSKITLQYKILTKNFNYRFSVNYLNYYRSNSAFDIVGIVPDTTLPANEDEDTIFQSLKIRNYYNQVNTYDVRFGAEYAIQRDEIRFYVGVGAIFGLHNIANSYSYFYKPCPESGYPVENVYFGYEYLNETDTRMRATNFLKIGADLSLGVDFKVAENCVVALQYTPEFAYYKWINEKKTNDTDNIFPNHLNSFWVFSPDFIDLLVYIRF